MGTSNANKHGRSNDPVWQLLAEYTLSEFLSDHDGGDGLAAGLLDQTKQELGLPPERAENIEMTLTRFARKAVARFKQRRFELPVRIRVFCQKMKVDEKIKGGWGYFLIERTEGSSDSPFVRSQYFVDLYIYREGG